LYLLVYRNKAKDWDKSVVRPETWTECKGKIHCSRKERRHGNSTAI
jgi:hypothetical protein